MFFLCLASRVQKLWSQFNQNRFATFLVNERDIEPTVTKKANQFISIKFGDIQLLEILTFLGGATIR